jgi:hypothetical protein
MSAPFTDTKRIQPQGKTSPGRQMPQPDEQSSEPFADDPFDPAFTDDMLHALAVALPWPGAETAQQKDRRLAAAFNALRSFDAQAPAEAMLATHAVGAHHFAMECYRRAASSSHTASLDTKLLDTAAMLSRTMGGILDSLQEAPDEPLWIGRPDNSPPRR